ncbi:lysine--tRNA ligase [Haliangium sp.]|uniref:lysine--tRNA ligase n=1 Tax=Haliangium sp. TaxID=2663208 RepID=UPI003D11D763
MSSPQRPEHTLERIVGERRDKANELRARGHNPYRNDFAPTHSCAAVRARYQDTQPAEPTPGIQPVDGDVVRLAGRVVARRGFGKTVFAPLRDGSGDLQLFINVDHLDADDFAQVVPQLDVGDQVGAEGVVFWTKRGEMSLLCRRLCILTKSLRPLPDKWKGLTNIETRYRRRYLDLAVNPEVREVFRKRSLIVRHMRRFFDDRDFLEVETPMMHTLIGGAAAKPFITHHNALDLSLYMRIAPELYLKRLLVGGFERVYEINRNFRNEGLSRQHNPEFTMLEFYQAYARYDDLMDLTEELVTGLAEAVNGTLAASWDGREVDLARPWRRLSVRDAVVEVAGKSAEVFEDPARAAEIAVDSGVPARDVVVALIESLSAAAVDELGGRDALTAGFADATQRPGIAARIVERYADPFEARVRAGLLGYMIFEATVEETLVQPTFLTQFPLAVSPLARKNEADPAFCDRFELFVGGAEVANGFSELNDPDDQRARFQAQLQAKAQGLEETMDYDEDYCEALELGMPPAAGEGIGIDRLVMLLTGQSSIRDVILFPLMRPEGADAQADEPAEAGAGTEE